MTLAGPDAVIEEYGYGLGPPTGMLVLRYARAVGLTVESSRDDHVHWLYWSPDGVLCARRGSGTVYLDPETGFWAERGHVHEVASVSAATVLRVGLRQVPPSLGGLGAGPVSVSVAARAALAEVARPGVPEDAGLAARVHVMAGIGPIAGTAYGSGTSTRQHRDTGFARQVAAVLSTDPADATTLEEWAHRLHISAKTLQRDFEREFGTSYTGWRSRLRLQAARALLRTLPVTETAHRVGYSSASAFVSAFTREFGETPGRWARR